MPLSNLTARAWLAGAALALSAGNLPAQTAVPNAVVSNPIVPVDSIIAVVNREVITSREVAERVKTVTQILSQQGTPLPSSEVLQKQVLERMISPRG